MPLDGTTHGLTFKPFQPGVQYVVARIVPVPITLVFGNARRDLFGPIRAIVTATELSTYLRRRFPILSLASIVRSAIRFPIASPIQ